MSEVKSQELETQAVVNVADSSLELDAFNKIVSAIKSLSADDAQMRVVKSALTFLGWADTFSKRNEKTSITSTTIHPPTSSFSEDRNLTAKQFIIEKKPVTDIERIACLAYYLTHYQNTPHFKTLDLSKLNTEAAQIKFSNAAFAVENAATAGLLVSAGKGNKQISANGELYVQALPDRDAAKAAVAHARPRRKNKKSETNGENEKQKK